MPPTDPQTALDAAPPPAEAPDPSIYERTLAEIREVYLADPRPWVIGYSGGKDSTTALQLIWHALAELPAEERTKQVYVIAGDTLVETPVVIDYLSETLDRINRRARAAKMPISAHKVSPEIRETFWVNLIGKGYPAPSTRFRWCTERMKINPANRFIRERVAEHGEVIMVLGVRRQESATRAQVMSLRSIGGSLLSRHSTLPNAFVYTPIRDYSVDDVWAYLLQVPNPWGGDNQQLLAMYRNSSAGECPLVVDTTTPSCGNSRFGCWVCTVVTKDKAMEAMIDKGEEWLEPLLDLRDHLASTQDPEEKRKVREHVRRDGHVKRKTQGGDDGDVVVRGPYTMEFCKELLRKLLEAQRQLEETAPSDQDAALISDEELHEIRRLWRFERHDWEDSLPRIYEEVTGGPLAWAKDDAASFGADDEARLAEICAEEELSTMMVKRLLDTERDLQGLKRRSTIMSRLDRVLGQEWRSEGEVTAEIVAAEAAAAEAAVAEVEAKVKAGA